MTTPCEVCSSPATERLCDHCSDLLSLYIFTQALAETVADGAR
jgi:hypothetical protein